MITPLTIREHERIIDINERDDRFDRLKLVSWDKPMDNAPSGYYASYKIGAEWIDRNEAIVVTTKRQMENIDFLSMFTSCFAADIDHQSFSKIYSIQYDQPPINAPALRSVISPLIVLHFLGVLSRIKTLKKGYVYYSENLKKVKGHIAIIKNERTNIAVKRYDRIYCNYSEYSVDIPENRLLKKALLFAQRLILQQMRNHTCHNRVRQVLGQCLAVFEHVSDDVDIKQIHQTKGHKLYRDYAEAIRLAKLVLRYFDYSIKKVEDNNLPVVPFQIDMSLLYENYVYGMLQEAYPGQIKYQFSGNTGYPDFLFRSPEYKAILDTKYIPKFENTVIDKYIIRQLCGYSRDLRILKYLGFEKEIPHVPCVIIYPKENNNAQHVNPFLQRQFRELCTPEPGVLEFYKLEIPLPIYTCTKQIASS